MISWENLEFYVARSLSGRITPGSGRFSTKGDVLVKNLYIECKQRSHYKLNTQLPLSWFKTAENNCLTYKVCLVPIIAFQLTDNVNSRVYYFCREVDSELFKEENSDFNSPIDWVSITEESLKLYCGKG